MSCDLIQIKPFNKMVSINTLLNEKSCCVLRYYEEMVKRVHCTCPET